MTYVVVVVVLLLVLRGVRRRRRTADVAPVALDVMVPGLRSPLTGRPDRGSL